MANYSTNEFKGGLKVMLDGDPCAIVENEFVKPGKGQAFNRVKLRNLITGVAMLPSSRPLTHLLLHAPDARSALERLVRRWRPDAVLAFCSGMAPLAMMPPLQDIPFVLDMVDADSGKWQDYARTSRGPLRWVYAREARCLGRFEEEAIRRACATLVVNERERQYLASRVPDADIRVLGNGIDIESFRPKGPPTPIPRVVFTGVFSYRPNERGALWFAREVWPLILARRPEVAAALQRTVGVFMPFAAQGLDLLTSQPRERSDDAALAADQTLAVEGTGTEDDLISPTGKPVTKEPDTP